MNVSALYDVICSTSWTEVIFGCMLSVKTEELIHQLRRAQIAEQKMTIFKPEIDDRYSGKNIKSHSDLLITAQVVQNVNKIIDFANVVQVNGIDEGHSFKSNIVGVSSHLVDRGKRLIVNDLENPFS